MSHLFVSLKKRDYKAASKVLTKTKHQEAIAKWHEHIGGSLVSEDLSKMSFVSVMAYADHLNCEEKAGTFSSFVVCFCVHCDAEEKHWLVKKKLGGYVPLGHPGFMHRSITKKWEKELRFVPSPPKPMCCACFPEWEDVENFLEV